MKFLVLILFICASSVLADFFTEDEDDAWQDFKVKYSKLFLSKNKEVSRKKTFLENRIKVLELKVLRDAGILTFNPTLYEHADLTKEEFLSRYGGYEHIETERDVERTDFASVRKGAPQSFDSRDYNWISSVKSQGRCGSCWTFSAIACIEAGLAVNGKTGYDLSEQLLVDCGKRGSDGCKGGRVESAFEYLSETGGVVQEHEYPYTGIYGTCRFPTVTSDGITVDGAVFPAPTVDSVKGAIMTFGAVGIALDADAIRTYKNGIFVSSDYGSPNHAVNIVGWGVEDDIEYWIIRNSWGTSKSY